MAMKANSRGPTSVEASHVFALVERTRSVIVVATGRSKTMAALRLLFRAWMSAPEPLRLFHGGLAIAVAAVVHIVLSAVFGTVQSWMALILPVVVATIGLLAMAVGAGWPPNRTPQ